MRNSFIIYASLLSCAFNIYALDIPLAVPNDTRIRRVVYKPNEVILIKAQRGVVTRIVLEQDEKIEVSVVGLSSRCESENDEWCIVAQAGTSQIFVRPRDGAKRNNMELRTNKRDYSFSYELVSDTRSLQSKSPSSASLTVPFYRVVLDYPKPIPVAAPVMTAVERDAAAQELLKRLELSAARTLPQADPDYGMTPVQRLKSEGLVVRNSSYSKQVLPKGQDANPSMVFDDGRFTYFEFIGAREIPAIFAYGSDEQPTRVNWHMQDSFVVVQRTARKFTLRVGDAVVGVFNDAFDSNGIETPTSTVSPAVRRENKEQSR